MDATDPERASSAPIAGGGSGSTFDRRRTRYILWTVCALGAALRLYQLSGESLWYDETASIFLSHKVDTNGSFLDPSQVLEPPMIALQLALWQHLVDLFPKLPRTSPWSDFLWRLLPALWQILSVPLAFVVGRRLFQRDAAALLAAFVFAISPFQIYYAQEVRIYSFRVFASLLAVVLFFRALDQGRWRYFVGVGACEVLLLYSHHTTAWFVLVLNLFFFLRLSAYKRLVWRWLVTQAASFVLVLPSLYLAWLMSRMYLDLEKPYYPIPNWKTGFVSFKTFFAGYAFTPSTYWPLFLLALATFAFALYALRNRRETQLFLALTVIFPIAGNVLFWRMQPFPIYEHRLLVFAGAMACIGVGGGLAAIRPRWFAALLTAVFVALTLPSLRETYAGRIHPYDMHRIGIWERVDFRSAANFIDAHWQEGDALTVPSHFFVFSMRHYLPHRTVYRLGIDHADAEAFIRAFGHEDLLEENRLLPVPIAPIAQSARRIWFLESQGITFENREETARLRAWLESHGWRRTEAAQFERITVVRYEREERAGK